MRMGGVRRRPVLDKRTRKGKRPRPDERGEEEKERGCVSEAQ
jgi:hypothetical protein